MRIIFAISGTTTNLHIADTFEMRVGLQCDVVKMYENGEVVIEGDKATGRGRYENEAVIERLKCRPGMPYDEPNSRAEATLTEQSQ